MTQFSILTDEFIREAASSGAFARQAALAAGQPVVFIDSSGRYVEEYPGGTRFEIRLDPGQPRETHRKILRQLTSSAA
ncbi:MAG: hypothetical protein JNN08_18555 [Bryobacterales bacterium]|nr:hypothetical protein [Bryobacterales bacterium]